MQRQQKLSGFSLVELLVTITVVGLLAAITVPAVQGIRLSAQQAECASNMRQIGSALLLYAASNDHKLPETSHTAAAGRTWIYTIADYLGNSDEVRICPVDPKGEERLAAGGTSYILNSFLFVPQYDPFGRPIGGASNNISLIENPARTMMAFVISDSQGVGDANDHTHSQGWTSWSAVTRDISPNRFALGRSSNSTSGSSNYLYADGHVEKHEATSLKERIERGENFAAPN
ncbi:MAG: type II secretion system protein [Verrucomicrobiota bacterium]